MRKYLLLASVAGCLMAGSAMAGTIENDGQSAVVGAKAKLIAMSTIESTTDMDFGTLIVDSSNSSNEMRKIATLSTSSNISIEDSEYVKRKEGTPAATEITIAGDQHTDIEIECVHADVEHRCPITNSSGLSIQDFTVDKSSLNKYKIGASLYAFPGDMEDLDYYNTEQSNSSVFRVTLKY